MKIGCCELHKDGKYQKWGCDVYDPKKRHKQYLSKKHKCIDCNNLIAEQSTRCQKCFSIKKGMDMIGTKLPLNWRKNIGLGQIGEKGNNWLGDNVGYSGLHKWVTKHKGRPKKCEHCGSTTAKKYEWANKSHEYKRDLTDWLRLCTPCHIAYDKNKIVL